jgi:hypothetical protein
MDKEGGSISRELSSCGFSPAQASGFLHEALTRLMQGLKAADLFDSATAGNLARLRDSVDINVLALRTGVGSSDVENGLTAVISQLMAFLKEVQGQSGPLNDKAGGLSSAFRNL